MRQYLLPDGFRGEGLVSLSDKESRYLVRVLRYRAGTKFNGVDREGNVYDLELVDGHTLRASRALGGQAQAVSDTLPVRATLPRLHLLQCLCKGKKDELIVRQATEAGVLSIGFVHSRYCVADLDGKSRKAMEARKDRLEAIIREAVQQSGSPLPTTLDAAVHPIGDLDAYPPSGLRLFFHQSPRGTKSLRTLLERLSPGEDVWLLVGSEGGFSDEECARLEAHGWQAVLLDTNILRAETASLYAIAACQTLLSSR